MKVRRRGKIAHLPKELREELNLMIQGNATSRKIIGFLAERGHSGINDANISAVYLPTAGEGPLARKKLEKAATILQNVLRCVIVKACKIECIRRHVADAAQTR